MKDKGEKELRILDTITKCVIRYALSISDENKDETKSEWFLECMRYLREREAEARKNDEK